MRDTEHIVRTTHQSVGSTDQSVGSTDQSVGSAHEHQLVSYTDIEAADQFIGSAEHVLCSAE